MAISWHETEQVKSCNLLKIILNRTDCDTGNPAVLASKQTFNFAEISYSRSDRNPSLVGNISTVGQRSNQQLRNSHPRNLSRLF